MLADSTARFSGDMRKYREVAMVSLGEAGAELTTPKEVTTKSSRKDATEAECIQASSGFVDAKRTFVRKFWTYWTLAAMK